MSQNPSEREAAKQRTAGIFDRVAPTYDRVGPRIFTHFGRALVQAARIAPGTAVLDVATGRGAALFPAAEAAGPSGTVVGIDLAPGMVEQTAREIAARGLAQAQVRQMDAEQLDFPAAAFDRVLCGLGLFFFPHLPQALAEFRRVCKPGGWVAVSTWGQGDDRWNWIGDVVRSIMPPAPAASAQTPEEAPAPVFDTPAGMTDILHKAGFTDVQVTAGAFEAVYADGEEWWQTLWSHWARGMLEQVEKSVGPAGLAEFQARCFERVETMRAADGIHQVWEALFTVGRNP